MRRNWLAVLLVASLLALSAAAALPGQTPRIAVPGVQLDRPALAVGLGLYEIQAPRFSEQAAAKLLPPDLRVIGRSVQQAALAAVAPRNAVTLFGPSPDRTMAIYSPANGSLTWFPDLSLGGPIPGPDDAKNIALDWVRKNDLTPAEDGGEWQIEDVTTLTRQGAGPDAKPEDVLRTARFVRMLDGLPVAGEHSILTVQVGRGGKVAGAVRDFRPLQRSARRLQLKAQDQLRQELSRKFDALVTELKRRNPEYRAELASTRMIYYEQGGRYLQPALFGRVMITGPEGIVGARSLLVSALVQTPEPIQERTRPATTTPRETKPRSQAEGPAPDDGYTLELTGLQIERAPLTAFLVQPDIRYGLYIVRDDSWDWVDDAWDFHTHLTAGNNLLRMFSSPAPKQTVLDQYFWNHVWLFRDGEGEPDYSPQFVRKVDFAVIEGHGSPYLITTRSNCCDVIYLNGIPGYGPNSPLGGRTDYVLWKSCHVIPAPPEDANWPDVWWSMFKGMRGNYGFCTSMWIDDDISDNFGLSVGLGAPNLSAWFSAVDSCKWNHCCDLEYGSAVMPCGQENQRIYDYTGLPNPDCLVIWWQHP